MIAPAPPEQTKETQAWPVDIRILAKYAMFFGVIMYARWIYGFSMGHDGIFKIGMNYIVGGDFINYWSAARLTLDHHIMILFDLLGYHQAQQDLFHHAIDGFHNWSYPPSFILLILWLGFLPYKVALIIWITLTFSLYAFAVAYKQPLPWALTLVLALAPSSYANFDIGQNGFLSAALLIGGLRLISVRPILAGVLFGLLSYKPQLGILVPVALLAGREWRVFTSAAITTVALIGTSIFLFGLEPWQAYWNTTLPYQRGLLEIAPDVFATNKMPVFLTHIGVSGDIDMSHMFVPSMMPTPFMTMRILGASLPIAYAIEAMTALGAILAVIYAFIRCPSPGLRTSVVLIATFMTSPYVLYYDMPTFTAGVIGTIAALGFRIKAWHLLLFIAAWFLPAFVLLLNKHGIPISPLVTVALLGLQLHIIKSPQHGANRQTVSATNEILKTD